MSDTILRVLEGPDGSRIVGRMRDGAYVGGWVRVYPDGKVETGTLWGGDVWEPASTLRETIDP